MQELLFSAHGKNTVTGAGLGTSDPHARHLATPRWTIKPAGSTFICRLRPFEQIGSANGGRAATPLDYKAIALPRYRG